MATSSSEKAEKFLEEKRTNDEKKVAERYVGSAMLKKTAARLTSKTILQKAPMHMGAPGAQRKAELQE